MSEKTEIDRTKVLTRWSRDQISHTQNIAGLLNHFLYMYITTNSWINFK